MNFSKILRRHRFKIGVDVDDVLFECVEYAVGLVNQKYKLNPPLSMDEITEWNMEGERVGLILEYFKDDEFYKNQPLLPGAVDFIKELCEYGDVYFVTAVPPQIMGVRATMLMKAFPWIPKERIIMTSSKNVVDLDILLDDGAHNILASMAKYKVLFRRPWNQKISGILAVNNYEEFLILVKEILYSYTENTFDPEKPTVVGLVSPSAGGKTSVAEALVETGLFEKPIPYTTRECRGPGDLYHFVTPEEFHKMKANGEFFETTVYAKHFYGTARSAVQEILDSGKHVILPIDICGAFGIKNNFENAIMIYVDRRKTDALKFLLERNISIEDKVNRIICMDAESENESFCDYTIKNNGTVNDAVNQVLKIFGLDKANEVE